MNNSANMKWTAPKFLRVGSLISWVSAAGYREGTIKEIFLAPSAAQTIQTWATISYEGKNGKRSVTICADDHSLKMFQVKLFA